ncbi:TonB-dependent receptor family protein [Ferruginibacter sp.]
MKKLLLTIPVTLLSLYCSAQQKNNTDSAALLQEVVITAFEQNKAAASGTLVKTVNNNNADRNNKTSLVNSFNSIAGVRMEERSPGSYRINIRGSSLRSPFGVRNVKVYWNNIPVTDPGGNTYFNQFAFNNFSSIEIVKGPAGSMYGAGTGGLLLMHSFDNSWQPAVSAEYITGSYGLQNILATAKLGAYNNHTIISYAHNQSNGYRDNSAGTKDNASFVSQLKISDQQQLTASVLYSNQYYQTPGGLTLAEYTANPRQARPAAGGLPSAATAKATIYQTNFLAGIDHQYKFSGAFKNSTSLYGSFAQIKNPTFRNYERRIEPSFGGRTSFVYNTDINSSRLQVVAGSELQEGFFNTQVSKNNNGNPDSVQTNDDIRYSTYSFFMQGDISLPGDWSITAGASINKTKVGFTRLSSYPVLQQGRTYKNELSPRLALQKEINEQYTVFASVSKGFSPPTIAELLPSTGVISTFLEAEDGTNYELGGKFTAMKNKFHADISGFYFKLNNALVSRKDNNNADYFVNAGNAVQKGVELSADYTTAFNSSFLDNIMIRSAGAWNDFKYGDFKKGSTDFSGKYLPGVPKLTLSLLADLRTRKGFYFNSTYYYAAKIFLDDANTASAKAYHLLGCRLGYKQAIKKLVVNIYAGADNLLDQRYSLGNDINATGGRYYNAAAGRNFYTGISIQLKGIHEK